MPLVLSSVGPENLLPQFLFMQGEEEGGHLNIGSYSGGQGIAQPFIPDDSCPDDIFAYASTDLRGRQLPYLTQDNWDCTRESTTVPTTQVENDYIIADIVPQWGGKVRYEFLYIAVNTLEISRCPSPYRVYRAG
jgi:hypothetical protein